MSDKKTPFLLNRRTLLGAGLGGPVISLLPRSVHADPDDMVAARLRVFGDRPVNEGRVTLDLPPIAENGYSVALTVSVNSPMTTNDYVRRIAVFSPRNPVAQIAEFHLTPVSGLARVSTRVRLAGTQKLTAIAEMSDGSLWAGSAETLVTLAACVVL